jgi:hypothetical protein
MGDVDILVPREARPAAIRSLVEAGWSVGGQSSIQNFSVNFRKGEFGEADLHRDVFHFSRRNQMRYGRRLSRRTLLADRFW